MSGKSIRNILVTLPKPQNPKSPFQELAEKYRLKVDFRNFIHVEGVNVREFREQKICLSDFNAVIFTSRTAIDHFFRITKELKYEIPSTTRFFCISEVVALYLQKYITYRKRKVFFGKMMISDLLPQLRKHKDVNYLLPCSDKLRDKIPETLTENNIRFTETIMYKTVISDLSDLENVFYDMLVFFSPSSIESLFKNFPHFKQNDTRIAVYGTTTANAAKARKLRIDVMAPQPEAPSIVNAIELLMTKQPKRKRLAEPILMANTSE